MKKKVMIGVATAVVVVYNGPFVKTTNRKKFVNYRNHHIFIEKYKESSNQSSDRLASFFVFDDERGDAYDLLNFFKFFWT